ncbi:leucine-rich repeat-containing protein 14-like [Acanthaster planci]|uniref:Leucine-rich repeat-containing protein 14-like n=1 Tax=Acanthaster planci TaxID=133434 RepID=A0A8B7YIV4_ACAPL|nr:leucine-rich repeat-containing protein 14-like [Acanthaster planci]XP_022092335.1 leucine-rich repeat-containing protein 14-like [Acanthaster planci]
MFSFDVLYGANTAASRMFGARDGVPSLLDRCARFIVTSWQVTRSTLNILPHDLYEVLLGEACQALLSHRSGSPGLFLTYLVQRWPSPVLRPGNTISRYRLDMQSHKKTWELVMHIVNGMCQPDDQCKLTLLDLSDIPINGSTCLNVLQKIFASLNSRSLTVVMDLSLDSENYHPVRRLLREVRHSKVGSLKVLCRRLVLNSLGKDRLLKVLSGEEPELIVALNLEMNPLENQGLAAVLPSLVKFPNLQALNLSYNLIITTKDQTTGPMVAQAFSNLKQLRRLSLSHNILTGSLRTLLEPLAQPLQALYICECKLSSSDLAYLANSRHARSLQELDLGFNNLKQEAINLEKLLDAAGDTLRYLSLDNTRLNQTNSPVKLWARLSRRLRKLVAVSMRGNDFSPEDQVAVLKNLAKNGHSVVYIGVCMVYEPDIDDFFMDKWDVGNDRVTQFFELYNACGEPEEPDMSLSKNKTRSVIVHDLDVVNKRDALIFIHNLEEECNP